MSHDIEAKALVALLNGNGTEVGELLSRLDSRQLFALNVAAFGLSNLAREARELRRSEAAS